MSHYQCLMSPLTFFGRPDMACSGIAWHLLKHDQILKCSKKDLPFIPKAPKPSTKAPKAVD